MIELVFPNSQFRFRVLKILTGVTPAVARPSHIEIRGSVHSRQCRHILGNAHRICSEPANQLAPRHDFLPIPLVGGPFGFSAGLTA